MNQISLYRVLLNHFCSSVPIFFNLFIHNCWIQIQNRVLINTFHSLVPDDWIVILFFYCSSGYYSQVLVNQYPVYMNQNNILLIQIEKSGYDIYLLSEQYPQAIIFLENILSFLHHSITYSIICRPRCFIITVS